MEYYVINEDNIRSLEEQINDFAKKGWKVITANGRGLGAGIVVIMGREEK